MKSLFKKLKKKLRELKANLPDQYGMISYSQEGEDLILRRIFEHQEQGFYIDVGAHHPKRFSNTYFFYKRGWSGINIDATPGSMKLFQKIRPRDINLEVAIAAEEKELTFFIFHETALNSFDPVVAHSRDSKRYPIKKEQKIKTQKLSTVLSEYLINNQKIDFLSIDVEGLDLEVLQSNNWKVFRPSYILVECLGFNFNQIAENETFRFLQKQHYDFFAKTRNTLIFQTTDPNS
jgi:FkbM family methyltransferase